MTRVHVESERINVFPIDDRYLFKHYFERTDLFEAISEYYHGDEYRFEVPESAFADVQERLADEYYDLVVIDDPTPFCVVKEQYTPHAEILRNAVIHWDRREHLFFVMTDERAVKMAVEQGATRLDATDFVLGI